MRKVSIAEEKWDICLVAETGDDCTKGFENNITTRKKPSNISLIGNNYDLQTSLIRQKKNMFFLTIDF